MPKNNILFKKIFKKGKNGFLSKDLKYSLFSWEYPLYYKYFRILAVISACVQMFFHFFSKYVNHFVDDFSIRMTAAIGLMYFFLVPTESSKVKLHHKIFIEVALAINLVYLFFWHILHNATNTTWNSGLILAGLFYGLLSYTPAGCIVIILNFVYFYITVISSNGIQPVTIDAFLHFLTAFVVASAIRGMMSASSYSIIKLKTEANKNASLGVMAGGVCHEINSPMMILLGNLELLDKYGDDANKRVKYTKSIQNAANRIKNVIDSLLIFTEKIHLPYKNKIMPIEDIVDEALAHFKNQFTLENINTSKDTSQFLSGNFYYHILYEILENLISNSIYALKKSNETEKFINIKLMNLEGKTIAIQIIDNGIGINETDSEKIFDPFFTSKEVGSGMGLGLSVSKALINLVQGELKLVNNKDHTIFQINLNVI